MFNFKSKASTEQAQEQASVTPLPSEASSSSQPIPFNVQQSVKDQIAQSHLSVQSNNSAATALLSQPSNDGTNVYDEGYGAGATGLLGKTSSPEEIKKQLSDSKVTGASSSFSNVNTQMSNINQFLNKHKENIASSVDKNKLLDILETRGLINQEQKRIILDQYATGNYDSIERVITKLEFVKNNELNLALSEINQTLSIDLQALTIPNELLEKIPRKMALEKKIIPIGQNENIIKVAMSDIYDVRTIDEIRGIFGRGLLIEPVYSPEVKILEAIDKHYEYTFSVDGILHELEDANYDETANAGDSEYVNPIVRLVDTIIFDAIHRGASDVHFEPDESFVRVRYRVDGSMLQGNFIYKKYWSNIAVRIKVMANLNIAETRLPQDGVINMEASAKPVELRVSTHPTVHGENVVMRILDQGKSIVDVNELGFLKYHLGVINKALSRPQGVIIITGPTGSGKTTTLYSFLNTVNKVNVNIMTLEDPVEYRLPMIRQSSINEKTGFTFSKGMRAIMRQDPDVILIGEIRDAETADAAIKASMTGHKVFTTLHTNDAISAINRLVDIGVRQSLLVGNISCIIAQRLIRILCKTCRSPYTPSPQEARILRIKEEDIVKTTLYKRGANCASCTTCSGQGYKGRTVVAEVLFFDDELDDLISTNATKKKIMDYVKTRGFITIQQDTIMKVKLGISSMEEAIDKVDVSQLM